ncbi:ABC transporter ATP-binding protein/permease [Actinocorallia sp. API 0066]|uniref:ABC transporter transmembrane domain-containing protein n=1 Tax=Actinocorallia sp. API 0066 TaxID=2896846 RepID=UPI001E3607BF|nr:ABC transporter ATP-binding protein [Actinocorallia sp. API 0066]MCD0449118.1 ABC transporter ATP-binding protein/permease [Actinocorallia sp. API 0066]
MKRRREAAERGRAGGGVLRQAVGGQWRDTTAGAVLEAIHQAGEALVPVVVGVLIDQAVRGGDGRALIRWIAVLALVFVGLSVSYRMSYRATGRAAERAAHGLRISIARRVLDPRGMASGRLPGELVSIATEDARRVGAVTVALASAVAAVVGAVVGGIALLRVSVPLGLLVLLGIPPLLVLAQLLARPLERRSEAEQERAAHASAVAADLVRGLRVVKGLGAEAAAVARYRRTSRAALAATLRAAVTKAWHDGGVLGMTGIFLALVALVGGRLAAQGEISVGDLVAAVGLAQFMLTPLLILGWANAEIAQGRASAKRIAALLAEPHAVPEGKGTLPTDVEGEIAFDEVSYGPLEGLTLRVAPGELLGVVAPDPRAAVALLRLLGRDADPDKGAVTLDGAVLAGVDPADVRRVVVVADHDADLFEGTVAENVAGPAAEPALAAAVVDLPQGGGTRLAEGGRSLSGGQRQRVALARALATAAPVLVLHDPTTAVDAATEARIADGVRATRESRTTVLVTTSPALLAVTDRVVLVADGAVADEGTHASLALTNPAYRTAVLS